MDLSTATREQLIEHIARLDRIGLAYQIAACQQGGFRGNYIDNDKEREAAIASGHVAFEDPITREPIAVDDLISVHNSCVSRKSFQRFLFGKRDETFAILHPFTREPITAGDVERAGFDSKQLRQFNATASDYRKTMAKSLGLLIAQKKYDQYSSKLQKLFKQDFAFTRHALKVEDLKTRRDMVKQILSSLGEVDEEYDYWKLQDLLDNQQYNEAETLISTKNDETANSLLFFTLLSLMASHKPIRVFEVFLRNAKISEETRKRLIDSAVSDNDDIHLDRLLRRSTQPALYDPVFVSRALFAAIKENNLQIIKILPLQTVTVNAIANLNDSILKDGQRRDEISNYLLPKLDSFENAISFALDNNNVNLFEFVSLNLPVDVQLSVNPEKIERALKIAIVHGVDDMFTSIFARRQAIFSDDQMQSIFDEAIARGRLKMAESVFKLNKVKIFRTLNKMIDEINDIGIKSVVNIIESRPMLPIDAQESSQTLSKASRANKLSLIAKSLYKNVFYKYDLVKELFALGEVQAIVDLNIPGQELSPMIAKEIVNAAMKNDTVLMRKVSQMAPFDIETIVKQFTYIWSVRASKEEYERKFQAVKNMMSIAPDQKQFVQLILDEAAGHNFHWNLVYRILESDFSRHVSGQKVLNAAAATSSFKHIPLGDGEETSETIISYLMRRFGNRLDVAEAILMAADRNHANVVELRKYVPQNFDWQPALERAATSFMAGSALPSNAFYFDLPLDFQKALNVATTENRTPDAAITILKKKNLDPRTTIIFTSKMNAKKKVHDLFSLIPNRQRRTDIANEAMLVAIENSTMGVIDELLEQGADKARALAYATQKKRKKVITALSSSSERSSSKRRRNEDDDDE